MKNANLGLLVAVVLVVAGCWLAGWKVDDREAFWIVMVSFWSGFAVMTVLEDHFPTKLPPARRR
jgi:cytochrome bd-type quinol oxidase subunit 2